MVIKGTAITQADVRRTSAYEDPPLDDAAILKQAAIQAMEHRYDAYDRQGDPPGALNRVNGMKEEFGNGVCTLLMMYNATGCRLTKADDDDHSGKIWKYKYDDVIENGQWSVVLHVKSSFGLAGSTACIGYELEGRNQVLVVAWDTPYSGDSTGWVRIIPMAEWKATDWDDFHDNSDGGEEEETEESGIWRTNFVASQGASTLFECVATRADIGYFDESAKKS